MCLRMNRPATNRVGNGGCPGPRRQTELKRPARKSQSISAARRTSGWRRLMIFLQRWTKQTRPDDCRAAGSWVLPNSESRRQRNHEAAKSGIPKRKKTQTHPRLSCKIEYLLTSNHFDGSITSEFFTGDFLTQLHRMQSCRRSRRKQQTARLDSQFTGTSSAVAQKT